MKPPERERRPLPKAPDPDHNDGTEPSRYRRQATTESRQVNWWTVHEFVGAVLHQVDDWPMLGTPAWCSLAHDDPRKWAALLDGAQHWALRMDSCQEARCEASRAVSGAVDWPALSREIRTRADFYAARPWLRRAAS
jgi:Protein of unknown function (DUF2742)